MANDNLDSLALELRAQLGAPSVDYEQQRRALARDPAARIPRGALLYGFGFAWAAVPALVLAAALLWFLRPASESQLLVAKSEPVEHRVSDGSVLQIAPGGEGRVEHSTEKDLSFELLRGRATVSVVPDVGHDWRLRAGPYRVKVIGTAYTVQYRPPLGLTVVVDHGVVSVSGGNIVGELRLERGARLDASEFGVKTSKPTNAAEQKASAPSTAKAAPAPNIEPTQPKSPAAPAVSAPDWEAQYRSGDYKAALRAARNVGFDKLLPTLSAQKLSNLADAARLAGSGGEARRALEQLRDRFPGTAQAARALFLLGRLDVAAGKRQAAIQAFEQYLNAAPSGGFAAEAIGRLMQLYSDSGRKADARAMAESYLQRAPDGPYGRLARSLVRAP